MFHCLFTISSKQRLIAVVYNAELYRTSRSMDTKGGCMKTRLIL